MMIAFSCPGLPGLQISHPAISFCERTGLGATLSKDVDELKVRITEGVATIHNAMLKRVWQELDHQLDVYRVTHVAHIKTSLNIP